MSSEKDFSISMWVWVGVLVFGGDKGAALFEAEMKSKEGLCFNCERVVRVYTKSCVHCGASLCWTTT
jgi:hypothetical protein